MNNEARIAGLTADFNAYKECAIVALRKGHNDRLNRCHVLMAEISATLRSLGVK